ncbi:hypothetical protein WN55_06546, partial [Dufourea novaeangliae]
RVPKIPTFFRGDPDLWFLQVEISFRNARITAEATKADAVLAALDMEVLSTVKDILSVSRRAPSPSSVESDIKRILASITSLSERVARLEARNNRPRSRAASRSRSSGNRGRSADCATPRLCVAHTKYPENPTSCKSWCAKFASWQTKN